MSMLQIPLTAGCCKSLRVHPVVTGLFPFVYKQLSGTLSNWVPLFLPASWIVESIWNVMAHGDAREKWRGNWRMEWVARTLHTTSKHGVSSITAADAHNSVDSSRLNWSPRRFKWLVRFAERQNQVSARVPSHFKRSLAQRHTLNPQM